MKTIFSTRPARTATSVMTLLILLVPYAAAATTVKVRDDDGSQEGWLDFDYSDDVAQKQLDVPVSVGLLDAGAKLWIYAFAGDCTAATGSFTLTHNGVALAVVDPCVTWGSGGSASWKSFDLSVGGLTPGLNTFAALDSGAHWFDRSVTFGIDTDSDLGRSIARKDFGSDKTGELMWYVEATLII